MDSKLKKTALITSVCMIGLISGLVLLLNVSGGKRPSSPVPSEPVSSGTPDSLPAETGSIAGGQIGNDLQAFLRDDTFFDPERNPYMDQLLESSGRLNIGVNSVVRDLRIRITDSEDNPVTGESFLVTVEGSGEYKDLDQDGVIYIADMEPGEYQISLNPIDGYRVPAGPVKVRVKDTLTFLPIEDIRLLMKQEADVEGAAEAPDFLAAEKSGDNSQITGMQETYGDTVIGINVSSAQEAADWDKVREAGIRYVIVRAGYRGMLSGSLVEDAMFEQHLKGAQRAGLSAGVVFQSQAVSEVEAVEEASMVLELIKDYNITYPVFLDMQGAGGDGRADSLEKAERTAIAAAFCQTIENAGYKSGIYAADYQLSKELNSKELEKYCIWLAEYRRAPAYDGYYQMWQYTAKGKIAGLKGSVCLNLSYLGNE